VHKRLTPNLHRMRGAGSGDGETATAAAELSAAGAPPIGAVLAALAGPVAPAPGERVAAAGRPAVARSVCRWPAAILM
jgi:hypothetical protein